MDDLIPSFHFKRHLLFKCRFDYTEVEVNRSKMHWMLEAAKIKAASSAILLGKASQII